MKILFKHVEIVKELMRDMFVRYSRCGDDELDIGHNFLNICC
jgi:hypothetical protein